MHYFAMSKDMLLCKKFELPEKPPVTGWFFLRYCFASSGIDGFVRYMSLHSYSFLTSHKYTKKETCGSVNRRLIRL